MSKSKSKSKLECFSLANSAIYAPIYHANVCFGSIQWINVKFGSLHSIQFNSHAHTQFPHNSFFSMELWNASYIHLKLISQYNWMRIYFGDKIHTIKWYMYKILDGLEENHTHFHGSQFSFHNECKQNGCALNL